MSGRNPLDGFFYVLFALILGGCGAFMIESEPDFEPKMRYSSDPIRVKIWKANSGELYLTDMEDDAIRRPWKAVGTFKALGPTLTSWAGAAREMGCDAFWVAHELTTHSGNSMSVTTLRSYEGQIGGVRVDHGDQLCLLFTDEEAEEERESELNWIFTAYQRPPMNAGWNFAQNIAIGGGYTMALEKYLRHIPLGLALRAGSALGDDTSWFTAGGMVLVPALNVWKLQLAPTAGLLYGFPSSGQGNEGEYQTALMAIAGGYADLVIARFFALGFGVEYWLPMVEGVDAPDGVTMLFRYGFAF